MKYLFGLSVLVLLLGCESEPEVVNSIPASYAIGGGEMHVVKYAIGSASEDYSKRAPLVVIHGGPVMDHSYFIPHLDALARKYQLIFYDQRASGRSSVAVDNATMNIKGLVNDIEMLRQELGYEKINLMGHSWGGLLAMNYAIDFPERLDKLILSNSMAPNVQDWNAESQEIGARVTQQDQAERQALISSGALASEDPREAVRTLLLQSFKHQMYDQANLQKLNLYVPIDFNQRNQAFSALGPDLAAFDYYADLSQVKCPVLAVYGVTEPATHIYAAKMVGAFPNARLEVIQNSGHFPFIENPEGFNKAVLAFLAQ